MLCKNLIVKKIFLNNFFLDIYEKLVKFYDSKALLPKKVIFELHCRDFINRHAISDKNYLKVIQ